MFSAYSARLDQESSLLMLGSHTRCVLQRGGQKIIGSQSGSCENKRDKIQSRREIPHLIIWECIYLIQSHRRLGRNLMCISISDSVTDGQAADFDRDQARKPVVGKLFPGWISSDGDLAGKLVILNADVEYQADHFRLPPLGAGLAE